MDRLSREEISAALEALASELSASPVREEVVVVGGAALVLLYDARASTKDVDVLVLGTHGSALVRLAAARVAALRGLPEDWLNDAAKGFLHGLALGEVLLDTPSLLVRAAAAKQLLAMKLCAWRDDVDIEDARLLLSKVPGSRADTWVTIEPFLVPGRELTAKYAFDDLWESEHGTE